MDECYLDISQVGNIAYAIRVPFQHEPTEIDEEALTSQRSERIVVCEYSCIISITSAPKTHRASVH